MLVIGLTGKICSGKSTVANLFSQLGITIISADKISHDLTLPNTIAFKEIIRHFGESVIDTSGALNRLWLRNCIFQNKSEREWLEKLLHPLIHAQIIKDIEKCSNSYCIVEIPLLPNKTEYPYLDRILLVTSNQEQQIQRLIARDKCSITDALNILNNQANDDEYLAIADDIIENNTTIETLSEKIALLNNKFSCKARK